MRNPVARISLILDESLFMAASPEMCSDELGTRCDHDENEMNLQRCNFVVNLRSGITGPSPFLTSDVFQC